ncbi:hypothetical protein JTB14_008022 [Gonioctena quinquepunctata]|nr:hypothetical protein JTB14_008022 [Gonioctena quinquepunctata]
MQIAENVTTQFVNTSLQKAVNNFAGVNDCYCTKFKSRQERVNVEFLPINENGVSKLTTNCEKCNNPVREPIDYTKSQNLLKEFKKEDIHMVLREGVYPYEWVDSYEKFNEKRPSNKSDWYSTLNEKHVKEADLKFAKKLYEHFKCKNFGDYHDIYLKIDTILLKGVFERNKSSAGIDEKSKII